MKKTYLEPKSETLMAVLQDVCDGMPTVDPQDAEKLISGSSTFGGGSNAPQMSRSL